MGRTEARDGDAVCCTGLLLAAQLFVLPYAAAQTAAPELDDAMADYDHTQALAHSMVLPEEVWHEAENPAVHRVWHGLVYADPETEAAIASLVDAIQQLRLILNLKRDAAQRILLARSHSVLPDQPPLSKLWKMDPSGLEIELRLQLGALVEGRGTVKGSHMLADYARNEVRRWSPTLRHLLDEFALVLVPAVTLPIPDAIDQLRQTDQRLRVGEATPREVAAAIAGLMVVIFGEARESSLDPLPVWKPLFECLRDEPQPFPSSPDPCRTALDAVLPPRS